MAFIQLEIADAIATITFNRPDAHNAMSQQFIEEFAAAAESIAADESVRAILIQARGKNFCVGGDINAFASESHPAAFIEKLAHRLHDGIACLVAHRAPVIVAVQGAAAGAGLSVAASGDIVIAGNSATFAVAYTGIGLTADGGASWFLPRLIGLRRTQELMLTGRRLNAAEAQAWGIVTQVTEDALLTEVATAKAARFAAGPTAAYAGVKRLLAASSETALADQLDAEAKAIGAAMASADAAEGARAFLERRTPNFSGR